MKNCFHCSLLIQETLSIWSMQWILQSGSIVYNPYEKSLLDPLHISSRPVIMSTLYQKTITTVCCIGFMLSATTFWCEKPQIGRHTQERWSAQSLYYRLFIVYNWAHQWKPRLTILFLYTVHITFSHCRN